MVLGLVNDEGRVDKVKMAAKADAEVYTLDNMVAEFVDGIEKCLAH